MSKLFTDEEWEKASEISDDVIKALKKILFLHSDITQEEAAHFLFGTNISSKWRIDDKHDGEIIGNRIVGGILKKGEEVKVKLCEDEIKAWHELFTELLKVSTF